MGFRFRRSVKLFPGARVNLGLRGASFSVGRPGATVNFSSRGTRSTFGVPGSGLSWTTSSGRQSYRRPSTRQLQAAARSAQKAALVAAAETEVLQAEQHHQDIVDAWQDMPNV